MLLLMMLVFGETQAARPISLQSPNGEIKIDITVADSLFFTVSKGDESIIRACAISLRLP